MTDSRISINAEVYVGERRIGTATHVEFEFGVEPRAPSVATGTMGSLSAWKVYAPKPLPPWTPEHREQVRRELKTHPMVEVEFVGAQWVGIVRRVIKPQPTVLRAERRARAANVRRYCRKCLGLGTKRHHALCRKRGSGTSRLGAELHQIQHELARYYAITDRSVRGETGT